MGHVDLNVNPRSCSYACQDAQDPQHQFPGESSAPSPDADSQAPGDGGERNNYTTWPADIPQAQRDIILDKFVTLHRGSFMRSILELRCLLHRQNSHNIDPDTQGVIFTLGYRIKTDGNPATRLFVKRVEIAHCEKLPSMVNPKLMAQINVDEVIGSLKIMFRGGGSRNFATLPLGRIIPDDMTMFGPTCSDWLNELRVVTTAGIVAEPEERQEGTNTAGVLQKNGKKWRWRKISGEDLAEIRGRRWRHMGPEPEVGLSLLHKSDHRK